MDRSVLKVLSNPKNQSILSLLAVEPSYPRRIARLIDLSESEVARRLRLMEKEGLVSSGWENVGENVKLYRLTIDRLLIRFGPDGLGIDNQSGKGNGTSRVTIQPVQQSVPVPSEFVGRRHEMDVLAQPTPVDVVIGLPGIGKTTLVANHASTPPEDRAVFWYGCRGVESLNWLANRLAVFLAPHGDARLLRALENGIDPAEKRALMLSALDSQSCMFVFDDVHRIEDNAVRDLLVDACRSLRDGRLVVASREPLPLTPEEDRLRILQLEGLSDDDVAEYLEKKGLAADPHVVSRLRERVGGHPMALNLLVESAKTHDAELLEILDQVPKDGLELYLLQEVYETLEEDERHAMTLASLFRTRFTQDDLQAITGKSYTGALLRLRKRLLAQYDGERYALHETLRHFFYSHTSDRKNLHQRLARHYLDQGTEEGRLEAMHHLMAAGRRDQVLDLLETNLDLREFEAIDAGYHDLYLSVLNMFEREDVQDDRRWALMEDERGDILYHRGENEAALERYERAFALFSELDMPERAADVAWKQALAFSRMDRLEQAAAACEKGLELAPETGRERERLETLHERLTAPAPAPATRSTKGSQDL